VTLETMPSYADNRERMEELDPENTRDWRKLKSTQHRALEKRVRDAEEDAAAAGVFPSPAAAAAAADSDDEGYYSATPGTEVVSEGLQHAHDEVASAIRSAGATTVPGVVKNVARAGQKAKASPQTSPPDAETFHHHVDSVVRNELRNIADANEDDDAAMQAVHAAMQELPLGTSPVELYGSTVLDDDNAAVATPGTDLKRLRDVVGTVREHLTGLAPQALSFPDDDDPQPGPSSDAEASSTRLQHPHVATALKQLSAVRQMDTQRLVSAIRGDSGKFTSKKTATQALDNLEQAPLTAKLFERGLLSAENVTNPQYVQAMEQSLKLREERTGAVKTPSARRSAHPQYTRTVKRPGGVHQYRRPHFDTAPMYTQEDHDGEGVKDAAQFLYTVGKAAVGSKKSKDRTRKQFVSGAKSSIGL